MIRLLFYLFIFFAPFTSFFALSAWLRLPVVVNQILFLVLLIGIFVKRKLKTKFIFKEDVVLLTFLILVWISFFFGFKERRSFNHSLAYTNAIIFFFFLTKYVINILHVKSLEIAKIVYWSFILSTVIILTDFIGMNYFGWSLRDVFVTTDGKISNMNYYDRNGFLRVGGVAEEPGTMSLFYNVYFAISLYYLNEKKYTYKLILPLFIVYIIAHFAMFSNAGISLAIFAVSFIFLMNIIQTKTISKNQILALLIILMLVFIASFLILVVNVGGTKEVFKEFTDKIFFNQSHKSYSSSGQRLIQWSRALSNFTKHPVLGSGPGFGVHEDSEGYLSVYLTVLADLGIIAFIFFFSFIKNIMKKALLLPIEVRSFILFALITSVLHLVIMSDFYHAPFWILCALIQLIYKETQK